MVHYVSMDHFHEPDQSSTDGSGGHMTGKPLTGGVDTHHWRTALENHIEQTDKKRRLACLSPAVHDGAVCQSRCMTR
jgi:hypothetical protein